MANDEKKISAVYVSWATMKSALEQLSQGMHSKLDRSVFTGMAWSVQNQLFAGLKFLGLMTENSDPTPALEDLVSGDEQHRKEKLKAILMDRYAALFALDLAKTTPNQLAQKMGEVYQVNGDTKEKAVRFFLSAVEYVGVQVSPLFKKAKAGSLTPRKKRTPKPKVSAAAGGTTTPPITPPGTADATVRTIQLKSGGSLTITSSMNYWALSEADRTFVGDLASKLDGYEKGSAGTTQKRPAA